MPEALLSQSPVTTRLTASPEPSIAYNTTANHHAHLLHCSKPMPAANVQLHVPASGCEKGA